MYLAIDNDSDLLIENGDLVWVNKKDAVSQHVQMRLATWLAESPYDPAAGLPYLTIIFQPGTTAESVKFILEQAVMATPGITGVDLDFTVDRLTRELTVTGTATGDDVEIDFTVTVNQ